jgi:hypothetical protein
MTEHLASADPEPSSNGRETNGRFASGNPGGPVNPFARQTATLRVAMQRTVTERDVEDHRPGMNAGPSTAARKAP